MAPYEQRFYLVTRNPLRRGWRNLRLLAHLLHLGWRWATAGARVRRRYRTLRRSGEPFWVD